MIPQQSEKFRTNLTAKIGIGGQHKHSAYLNPNPNPNSKSPRPTSFFAGKVPDPADRGLHDHYEPHPGSQYHKHSDTASRACNP